MPWRLIFFVVILAIFLLFIGKNLEDAYRCDINLIFTKLEKVYVFNTIFVSFALGFICSLPFVLRRGKKRGDKLKDKKPEDGPYEIEVDEKIKQDAAAAKERFLANRRGK